MSVQQGDKQLLFLQNKFLKSTKTRKNQRHEKHHSGIKSGSGASKMSWCSLKVTQGFKMLRQTPSDVFFQQI